MVDRARITDRLEHLDSLLVLLDRLRRQHASGFGGDDASRLAAERALQVALQIVIDVGAHIVSARGLPTPSDYRGVFASLLKGGVIGPELADRLSSAVGLRNRLVHAYADLDEQQLLAALQKLDDLRAFAVAALATTGEG